MDENLSRGYVQLGTVRGFDFTKTNGFNHLSPPVDKCNLIYSALVLAGVGFLMPYNSFMMAVDYFKDRYPDTTVVFDMSVVYVTMAFFAVLANNILVETVSLNKRIIFGYLVSIITLNFVVISEIWWQFFGVATSYTINLIAVAVVAVGCTVQQSSFYGYTSMLPSRYTQAVMAGEKRPEPQILISLSDLKALSGEESEPKMVKYRDKVRRKLDAVSDQEEWEADYVIEYPVDHDYALPLAIDCIVYYVIGAAGFWVSVNRILTKSLVNDERGNTSMFFTLSIMTIGMCSVLHWIVRKTEFVQFYVNLCQERNRIILEPSEDVGLMDPMDQTGDPSKGQYGVLKIQTSPLGTDAAGGSTEAANGTGQYSAFSFSNPVYEPSTPAINPRGSNGPTYKVEDVVVIQGAYYRSQGSKPWARIKRGMQARLEVAKLIYPYMSSIAVAYFVTLCLYPGILSEIISCKFESWMPVILMAAFNGADLLGKILASIPYEWTRTQLLYFSGARIILIPLFLLCATPRNAPTLSGEGYPVLFSWLLGLTNGIVGSVPMIQAPSKVPEQHRELAGNIMTLSYTTGLAIGSVSAYVLDALLGPVLPTKDICVNLSRPTIAIGNVTAAVLTTVARATVQAVTSVPSFEITTTALTAMLTTPVVINNTLPIINNGIVNASSTAVSKFIANASSTISNSILQH